MRAFVPDYELVVPRSLDHALQLLGDESSAWLPFAGGTDLMVLMDAGKLTHKKFVSLWPLDDLRGIEEHADAVRVGALTTYSMLRESPVIRRDYAMLAAAARETGAVATQNRGTLGGNIANASPAADSPPALLAYDAEIELLSSAGSRRVRYADFHLGYKQMAMRPGEIISNIWLPRRESGWSEYYRKVGTRRAQAISKICMACAIRKNGDQITQARIALASVAPVPLRCRRTEGTLEGQFLNDSLIATARRTLAEEIAPIDDIRSTRDYRTQVAGNLLEQFLRSL